MKILYVATLVISIAFNWICYSGLCDTMNNEINMLRDRNRKIERVLHAQDSLNESLCEVVLHVDAVQEQVIDVLCDSCLEIGNLGGKDIWPRERIEIKR